MGKRSWGWRSQDGKASGALLVPGPHPPKIPSFLVLPGAGGSPLACRWWLGTFRTLGKGSRRFHVPRRFWLLSLHASRASALLMAGRSHARGETMGQQGEGGTCGPRPLPLQLLTGLLGSAVLSHSYSPCKPRSVLSLSHIPLCLECPRVPFHQVALLLTVTSPSGSAMSSGNFPGLFLFLPRLAWLDCEPTQSTTVNRVPTMRQGLC